MAPGHPPIVKITTSHKLASKLFGDAEDNFGSRAAPVSRSLGRKTLNMVYADKQVSLMCLVGQRSKRTQAHRPPSSPDFSPPHNRATAGALAKVSKYIKPTSCNLGRHLAPRLVPAYYPARSTSPIQYYILLQRTTR